MTLRRPVFAPRIGTRVHGVAHAVRIARVVLGDVDGDRLARVGSSSMPSCSVSLSRWPIGVLTRSASISCSASVSRHRAEDGREHEGVAAFHPRAVRQLLRL
jgi:hypothetical protein